MTTRRPAMTALALIAVPALLAAAEAAWYHAWIAENSTLVSSGQPRKFHLYVPPSYDPARPAPLVLSMHGAGMRAVAQMHTSRWNEIADREGLLVAYPSAIQGDGPLAWDFEHGGRANPDVRFITDLIAHVAASYNVDRRRIYVNGLSNGGGMSFAVSCTMSDMIAAVGLVGAAFTVPWEWCEDRRPVPAVFFHGTNDTAAPYHGGRTWITPPRMAFPSIPHYAGKWAIRNQCTAPPTTARVAADVTRLTYGGCAGDAPVELYTIDGGGHTWPGGGDLPEWFTGKTTRSINASAAMWEFFREHPLQQALVERQRQ